MNIQELQVVASEQLPVKILVVNNHALGKITEVQAAAYQGRFLLTTQSSGYSAPDFVKVAQAYGIKAVRLGAYHELDTCCEWLHDTEPCLIDISLPEDTLLLPKMNWNEKDMLPLPPDKVLRTVKTILS